MIWQLIQLIHENAPIKRLDLCIEHCIALQVSPRISRQSIQLIHLKEQPQSSDLLVNLKSTLNWKCFVFPPKMIQQPIQMY